MTLQMSPCSLHINGLFLTILLLQAFMYMCTDILQTSSVCLLLLRIFLRMTMKCSFLTISPALRIPGMSLCKVVASCVELRSYGFFHTYFVISIGIVLIHLMFRQPY